MKLSIRRKKYISFETIRMQIDCIHIFSNAKFKVLHECSTVQEKKKKKKGVRVILVIFLELASIITIAAIS